MSIVDNIVAHPRNDVFAKTYVSIAGLSFGNRPRVQILAISDARMESMGKICEIDDDPLSFLAIYDLLWLKPFWLGDRALAFDAMMDVHPRAIQWLGRSVCICRHDVAEPRCLNLIAGAKTTTADVLPESKKSLSVMLTSLS